MKRRTKADARSRPHRIPRSSHGPLIVIEPVALITFDDTGRRATVRADKAQRR